MAKQTYMRPSSYAAAIPEGNYSVPEMSDILANAQTIGGMAKAYQTQEQQRELGEAMAGIPEAETASRVTGDTEQSAMLAEQTADFADTPGGIPESEAAAQQSAGQTRMSTTTRDWKSWEDTVMERAAKMGPEAVVAAQQYIQQTQQSSFEKDAMNAMRQMQTNPQAAARALERAYSNMPDGNSAEVSVGPDGTLMLQLIDEETGEPAGNPEPIDQEDIAEFVQMTRDPVAWSEAVQEGRIAAQAAKDAKGLADTELGIKQQEADTKADTEARLKAQAKVDDELNEQKFELEKRKQELEGRQWLQGGTKRAAELRKLEGEIKLNESKAAYYAAGGSSGSAADSYFDKRNDIMQRLNTAGDSLAKAAAEIAPYQRMRNAAIEKGTDPKLVQVPPAIQEAYDREVARYDQINAVWDELDRQELAKIKAARGTTEVAAAVPGQETAITEPMNTEAPPSALAYLQANPTPEIKQAFQSKYGYLPPGM